MTFASLPTELHRRDLLDLDLRPTAEQVQLLVEDQVHAIAAVQQILPALTAAVDAISDRMSAGDGRMIYVGAGTPGRLGLQDASECPPTFGTDRVIAILAGGEQAAAAAQEGAEDDGTAARRDLEAVGVGPEDVVVGVTASGRTPYTISAAVTARRHGALTVGISCNPDSELSAHVDHAIEVLTGPELIAGSTRLKAGTAQKVVLNTLSTLVMVRLGKTFGNLMVDVRTANDKLQDRSERMVLEATGVTPDIAQQALDAAGGNHKVAIVALLTGSDVDVAAHRLDATSGSIRRALEEAAPGERPQRTGDTK
jgi:N-acetylmuramic acid 6-phosphate etherase